MAEKTIAGVTVEVDEGGFLLKAEQWTKEIAVAIAQEEGIDPLTEQHWQVIEYMRKVKQETGESPTVRKISKQSGIDTKVLYSLFPGGPGKKAAKIAGVPKPVGCV
jgi:dissimilatory sulfite reductase related protein